MSATKIDLPLFTPAHVGECCKCRCGAPGTVYRNVEFQDKYGRWKNRLVLYCDSCRVKALNKVLKPFGLSIG